MGNHTETLRLLSRIDCAAISLLIVEDNDASRRLIVELLRAAGFNNLTAARDAEEAQQLIREQAPDLLLLDWNLPGMSGIELTKKIRASAVTPDRHFSDPKLPIVMLTGRQRAQDVQEARNAGVNEFVVKPFSTTTLLRGISGALVKKRRFVVNEAFIGPDRRRRKAGLYPGLLRREEDIEVAVSHTPAVGHTAVGDDIAALRQSISVHGEEGRKINREAVNMIVTRMIQAQTVAHDFRMKLIEQATQSLNDYVRLFGDKAESEVLDVHMNALVRLNEAPYANPEEAVSIVKHLNTLVNKRRASRKVTR